MLLGMCLPNAKEVKTNQNAKLWILCKAFVNTLMHKHVYCGIMNCLISSHEEALKKSRCISDNAHRSVGLHSGRREYDL